jgi:RNA-directed DNA polymerase
VFSTLTTIEAVANLLGCSRAKLRYLLYRLPPDDRYRGFNIAKKGNGARLIQAPIPEILELQQRLHFFLLESFQPKHSTHGFTIGRSILTNARAHLGANVLLNIDLENFFAFNPLRPRPRAFYGKAFRMSEGGRHNTCAALLS